MALLLWLCGVFLAAFVLWRLVPFLRWYYRASKAVRSLPSFPGHWFWGDLPYLKSDEQTLVRVCGYAHANGYRVTAGWLGPLNPVIGIVHPEPLKKILKEPKDSQTYNLLRPWLGDGLRVSEGPKWARNRRLLTPAFHYEILKSYVSVYNSCIQVLLDKWSVMAARNDPVKMFNTVGLLSLDIILQCAFSYRSDCQTVRMSHPYIKCVYDLSDHMAVCFA